MNPDGAILQLRRVLFGIPSTQAAEAAAEYGRQQAAKYSQAGLQYVEAAAMPDAVDRVFDSLALAPGRACWKSVQDRTAASASSPPEWARA